MTWKEKIVYRILLIIAGRLSNDEVLRTEIKNLATTIQMKKENPFD